MSYIDPNPSGTTADRPTLNATSDVGYRYFDTSLGTPVFWDGADWRLASGALASTAQTITVLFNDQDIGMNTDAPGNEGIPVKITTSDTLVTDREVTVQVRELLTGTAVPGVHYDHVGTQLITFAAGTAHNTVDSSSATLDYIVGAPGMPRVVDLILTNATNAELGTDTAEADLVDELTISTGATLDDGMENELATRTFTVIGGVGPYTIAVQAGALPVGMAIAGLTITGTPTVAGPTAFTIRATDTDTGDFVDKAFTMEILVELDITTADPMPDADDGAAYSEAVAAVGGAAPLTFALAPGSDPLPTGLTINAAGTIAGTPVGTGVFPFTVRVTDSSTPTVRTFDKLLSITVNQTVTVQFTGPTDSFSTGDPSPHNDPIVSIITSDGAVLAVQVEVDVLDAGTGSAADPADYTVQSPQHLTFIVGSASGATQDVQTTFVSPGTPPKTIDRTLANPVAATIGAQSTHTTTLAV